MKKTIDNYFQSARNWFDDVYLEAISSRNRYRFAFIWCLVIITLLILSFALLLPLQHTQFVVLHHIDDGTVWLESISSKHFTINQAQIESDIVRYVINRESYSAENYNHHYTLVNLLSSDKVSKEYQHEQNITNPDSPINQFKKRFVRRVRVQNIIFLNREKKHRLAQVNFVVSDYDQVTGRKKQTFLLALISWKYHGVPKDPRSRWLNWDGFIVSSYSIQQRTL